MSAKGPERKSTGKTDWETPDELVEFVERMLRLKFSLDGAASESNKKCERFYSEEDDAFKQDPSWEHIWLNPPYGDGLAEWIQLAVYWGRKNVVAVILPANTDTKWFHFMAKFAAEIWFLEGRVQFKGTTSSNTGGSVIAIFRPSNCGFLPPVVTKYVEWKK